MPSLILDVCKYILGIIIFQDHLWEKSTKYLNCQWTVAPFIFSPVYYCLVKWKYKTDSDRFYCPGRKTLEIGDLECHS